MAHSIEELIHAKLEDLVGDTHDLVSKAQIVAEAEALFLRSCKRANVRTAATAGERDEERQIREAALMDALLQATGRLTDWDEEDGLFDGAINGIGLSVDQILHSAAKNAPPRFASPHRSRSAEVTRILHPAPRTAAKNFGLGDMDIINDEDLEVFKPLTNEEAEKEGSEALNFDLVDGSPNHDPSLFHTPGTPMNRSTWRS